MNPMQIAQLALSILSLVQPVLQPLEAAGIQALMNAINQHKAAGQKLSFKDVNALAAEHKVNMNAVYARTGLLGIGVLAGGIFAASKAVKRA